MIDQAYIRLFGFLFGALLFGHGSMQAQALSLNKNPLRLDEEVTLTIDVNKSESGGLKPILETNGDLPVYIWTWNPSGPVGGNGDAWENSNPNLVLVKESSLVYSLTFVPQDFYEDASQLYSNGISCLAKLKNGNDPQFVDTYGEAKTEDFHISVLPPLCEDRICVFPEIRRDNDFVSITYNAEADTTGLVVGENDEVYLQVRARDTEGNTMTLATDEELPNVPELRMNPVPDDPGKYRLVFLPEQLFASTLAEGADVDLIVCYPMVQGFTYPPDPTPWNAPDYEFGLFMNRCD